MATTMPKTNRLALVLAAAAVVASCAGGPGADLAAPDPNLVCAPSPVEVAAKSEKAQPNPNPDRGMGGTGIYAQDSSPGERGSGGTGALARVDDRGMGGTGIVGTVTGFGSICVNGFRVTYDDATPVKIDGLTSDVSRVARGQTVLIDADAAMSARTIAVQSALVGPVTATGDGALAVMGQTLTIDDASVVDSSVIAAGEVVAVSGLQRRDGTIVVTRIAAAPDAEVMVRGYVTAVDQATVTVGAVKIDRSGFTDPITLGAWTVVRGRWTGSTLVADRVAIGAELPRGARLSIEGFVEAQAGGGYVVRGVPVGANVRAGLDAPTIARLSGVTRVQMLGNVERGRSLAPSTIVVPDAEHPFGGVRPVRPAGAGATPPPRVQEMRGTYGRPLDPSLRPKGLPQRPQGIRRPATVPPIERPPAPVRPEAPVRPPGAPVRPTRPGVGG